MEYKAIIKGERIEILVNNEYYRTIVHGTTTYEHGRVVFIDLETGSSVSIANENVIIEFYKNELLGENNEFYNNWNANLSWCTDR